MLVLLTMSFPYMLLCLVYVYIEHSTQRKYKVRKNEMWNTYLNQLFLCVNSNNERR